MSKKIECFEDLYIWQKAVEYAKDIYLITDKKGLKNDFGLKDQIASCCCFNFDEYR